MNMYYDSFFPDSTLEQFLERALAGAPVKLAEAIRYSVLAPGKRIRPRLAMNSGRMVGIAREAAAAAATAIELVHCYTLIHDDLPCLDNDDFRRGRPSNHKQFGEATALLAGDALTALAFEALLTAAPHVTAPQCLTRATARLAWAMGPRGVVGGQAAELALSPRSTIDELRTMFAGKTGALFKASLLLPADLADLPPGPRLASLERFAAELGFAFQVADDLEDGEKDRTHLNILHHLPAHDARMLAIEQLGHAKQELFSAWGNDGGPLASIAGEVTSRLSGET